MHALLVCKKNKKKHAARTVAFSWECDWLEISTKTLKSQSGLTHAVRNPYECLQQLQRGNVKVAW
jgi:hypothetical protein